MIVLTVLSYSGVPAEGLSARFDELGGSIGRADNNQLVLPDPERSISRLHARVVFRNGGYAIVDNGSNPIAVNGNAVPTGREQALSPGDQVQIGSYLLAASQGAPGGAGGGMGGMGGGGTSGAAGASGGNVFDDLFGDAAHGLAAPAAPAPAPPRPAATPWTAAPMAAATPWTAPPMSSAPTADARWGASASAPASAPAQAWSAQVAPAAPAARAAPAAPAPYGARPALSDFPDDFDFLAPDPSPAPAAAWGAAAGGAPSSPLGLPIATGMAESLDDLFGLGATPTRGDPLGAAPRQALLAQPNMAAHADPLRSLGLPAAVAAASASDHVSELNTPMPLPYSAAPPARPPVAPAVGGLQGGLQSGLQSGQPGSVPSGAVFSWDDPPRDGRVVTLPGQGRPEPHYPARPVAAPAPAPSPSPSPSPSPAPTSTPTPTPTPPPAAALPARPVDDWLAAAPASAQPAPADGALLAALLAALLQGLGVPGLRIEALSPALLLLVGQLLRESTRGAVELLVARAALKREMRAQMTMIVAQENNPLKFSPSVEAALQHLLSPPTPGFMAPAPAMRDAFDDLRAHQLGVMAGMKSAFDGVLQRFDPQQLEAKLTKRSAINSLIPATRKAKLWESFQALFGQLSREAQDDFDELFGKAFLAAYEAQMDRLQNEAGPRA